MSSSTPSKSNLQTCKRCGQSPVKVHGTEPLVDGLCWFCRMRLRTGRAK